jgi:alkylation response protein AidB-like acyl-CoA dehydrogenase
VRLELTPDQEFFRSTTARFFDDQVPVGVIRTMRDDPAGFTPDYWRRGADLGWTTLLVDEDHGGGSVSGEGVVDLSVIAHEFGRHAAPGPFVTTNLVARALSDAGGEQHRDVLAALLSGTAVASWCPTASRPGVAPLQMTMAGGVVRLNGLTRPVESAAQATHLLVTGRTDAGTTQVLVPTDSDGVSITPMHNVDLTRRFAAVTFSDVRVGTDAVVGEPRDDDEVVQRQVQLALVMLNAESIGAMEAAFDMTVTWAFDRYSFGRPLASYQALKHRFADMKSWLEASHAISDAATDAVEARSADAPELVSVAKAYIGHYGLELLQDCVQLHGGIGVTYEHDLHLFLRRATLNRALFGTPAEHKRRIADLLEFRGEAA